MAIGLFDGDAGDQCRIGSKCMGGMIDGDYGCIADSGNCGVGGCVEGLWGGEAMAASGFGVVGCGWRGVVFVS
ncbi:hypothetical protein [Sporosarcina sp. P13]|uniref:hypothetical protein n=1 Tax=Sporosarcina sp. P13 TaxID=2048263 RepID=UPI0013045DE8|nr:hypothetical protein [Sporosarcina sp. P13]